MNRATLMLMPPKPGTCPICAAEHEPAMPHNRDSLYYQYRFYAENKRWPTWKDAMAHCAEDVRKEWIRLLAEHGVAVEGN